MCSWNSIITKLPDDKYSIPLFSSWETIYNANRRPDSTKSRSLVAAASIDTVAAHQSKKLAFVICHMHPHLVSSSAKSINAAAEIYRLAERSEVSLCPHTTTEREKREREIYSRHKYGKNVIIMGRAGRRNFVPRCAPKFADWKWN